MGRQEKEPVEDLFEKAEREAFDEAIWEISDDTVGIRLVFPKTTEEFSIIDLQTLGAVNLTEGIKRALKGTKGHPSPFPRELTLPQNPDTIN